MAIDGIIVADGPERRRDFDNPVAGDIPQYDGTDLVRIAVGVAGQVFRLVGAVGTWKTFLEKKKGVVAAGSFTGTPRTATVTFAGAFPDATYSVTISAVTQNGKGFSPTVESKVAGSFIINLHSNKVTDLTEVCWAAGVAGET